MILLRLVLVRRWRRASSARGRLCLRSATAATAAAADHVHHCRLLQALVRPTSRTNVLKD